jgi:hypothetical protein
MAGTRIWGRQALLAGVSVCALLAVPSAASAACTTDTTTTPGTDIVTCTGTIDGGTDPAVSYMTGTAAVQINSDATLSSSGNSAYGIFAYGEFGVSITSSGPISTAGGQSYGIIGRSNRGAISITSSGAILTTGDATYGIQIESFAANGGVGVAGSTGGAITVSSSGSITTTGVYSDGLQINATGGNGGNGQAGASGSYSFSGMPGPGVAGNAGASGGTGSAIAITTSGAISTAGSHGIFAVSTGGNGGDGGSGGNGGDSIFRYEAGGTGGNGGAGGSGGGGGAIDITVNDNITVSGGYGTGVYARSHGGSGGGGGAGGLGGTGSVPGGNGAAGGSGAYGAGGNINVTVDADINASDSSTYAIFAGSSGYGGDVTVTIDGGLVRGGDSGGVYFYGDEITLNNSGILESSGGHIISGQARSVNVINTGIIKGSVLFGVGTIAEFDNRGGLFETGTGVWLYGGLLSNTGTISPGGDGTITTTIVDGNFNQSTHGSSVGTLLIDADWDSDSADKLVFTGVAAVAGSVSVIATNFPDSSDPANTGLTKTFRILEAATVTDNGLAVQDTAAVDYSLLFSSNAIDLQAVINFLGGGGGIGGGNLTGNQASVGTTLNKIVEGGGGTPFVGELMHLPTQGELEDALDQLTPAGDASQISSAMKTGNTFAGQLLSCRTLGEDDPNAVIREGQCLWVRAQVRQLDNDGRNGETGFDETATFYSAGAQFDLGGPWRVGAGIGFEDGDLRTGSNAQSETERLHLGGVIKYNPGPLLLAASLTGGHGWSDNTRAVAFGAFTDVATSESDQSFISGRLTAAYLLSHGHWYAKPQVDLAWTHLERDAYVEQSSGGTALAVGASDDTVFSVSPSIEFGAQYALAFGGVARPYVKAGVTWLDTDSFVTSAAFQGVPPGTGGFEIATTIDDVVADLGLGVDFLAESGTVLRVQYDGQFGDQTEQHGGSAKLSVPF